MSISLKKKERFHFLDGLRGIAASMIVMLHAFGASVVKLANHMHVPVVGAAFRNFTQSGVVLFFVLSGVVLLRPYMRRERTFKAGDYFLRRFKRLYPPYFFALIFAGLVVYLNNCFPTWYNESGLRAVFSWREMFKHAFIIRFDGFFYNLAWWSLGIEIVFYIMAPLTIFIFPGKAVITDRKMFSAIVITLLIDTLLQLYLNKYFPSIYSIDFIVPSVFRFIEYPLCFLMGVFLATKDFNVNHAFGFIAFGLILIFVSNYYSPILHSGYGLIYAGIIILLFNVQSFAHLLSKPFMIWLGERSYSLFLIHFSVFYMVDNIISHFVASRNMAYFILTRGIGITAALFAAMLLFTFVEKRYARGLVTGDIFWPWQVHSMKIYQDEAIVPVKDHI